MLLRTVDSKAKTLSMAKHVHQMQTKWSERAERDHDQTYVGKKKRKTKIQSNVLKQHLYNRHILELDLIIYL